MHREYNERMALRSEFHSLKCRAMNFDERDSQQKTYHRYIAEVVFSLSSAAGVTYDMCSLKRNESPRII